MDEISIAAPTRVAELREGDIQCYTLTPEQFGMARAPLASLAVESAAQSLEVICRVFAGEAGPAADIVALNAGAAIYAAGLADDLEVGVARARQAIASGGAAHKLEALVEFTQSLAAGGQA